MKQLQSSYEIDAQYGGLYTYVAKSQVEQVGLEERGHKPEKKRQVSEPKSENSLKRVKPDSHTELPPSIAQDLGLGDLLPPAEHLISPDHTATIPDGIYRFLWMNNNQIPTFQHLLCRPVSSSASNDGKWDGEILQRISGAKNAEPYYQ